MIRSWYLIIDEFGKVLNTLQKTIQKRKCISYSNSASMSTTLVRIFFCLPHCIKVSTHTQSLKLEQKQEWTKVKVVFRILFSKNPLSSYLISPPQKSLPNERLQTTKPFHQLYNLAIKSKFANDNLKSDVVSALYPMDVFAAYILTQANQRYGQNERSLFSFLEATGDDSIAEFLCIEQFSL